MLVAAKKEPKGKFEFSNVRLKGFADKSTTVDRRQASQPSAQITGTIYDISCVHYGLGEMPERRESHAVLWSAIFRSLRARNIGNKSGRSSLNVLNLDSIVRIHMYLP